MLPCLALPSDWSASALDTRVGIVLLRQPRPTADQVHACILGFQ